MVNFDYIRNECYVAKPAKLFLFGILLLTYGECHKYSMQSYCDNEFSFILLSEYQIELSMDDTYFYSERDSRMCETKFEAWYSFYSNFMIYFEDLNLDCSEGHLEFYNGARGQSRVTGLEGDICGSNKPDGVLTVENRYFRIRYVPKKRQYLNDVFKLVITAYGTGDCPSYGHTCSNGRCINDDIVCNGRNSCGDNSSCVLSTAAIIGIVVGSVAGLAIIVTVIVFLICCSRRSGAKQGTTVQSTGVPTVVYNTQDPTRYSQPLYGVNQDQFYNAPPPRLSFSVQHHGANYPTNTLQNPSVSSNTNVNNS